HLNENSELTFIAGRNSRELSLTGEAFFDVARDEERPFSITTGEVTTTVLGTSFNVRAYPNEPVEVAVTSGRVEVADADEEVVITEEQVVTYEPVTKVLSAPKEDVVQAEAWVREELVVKGKRLEDVIPALERFFGREIEFGNPALRNCIVEESTFYADDWAGAMANLAFRYGAKEQGGRIVLTGDEC
ncbi:MAG: FecR domain-containing protein, partial [Bacteroidota bacterium]